MTPEACAAPPRRAWLRLGQLGWLVTIWIASVATVALIAYGFRLFMSGAGLTR